jgi:outer membrane protein OmpA-like peptidoglycan-associated protein
VPDLGLDVEQGWIMSGSRCGNRIFAHVAGVSLTLGLGLAALPGPALSQPADGVSVNLDALNDLDPMMTQPRLLMPSAQPRSGRIVLTPPAGVDPITPQRSRIVLRPPPGAPARIQSAPTIAVAPPAEAASEPPTPVTAPPPAPAKPEPVMPEPAPEPEAPAEPEVAMTPEPEAETSVEESAEPDVAEPVANEPEASSTEMQTASLPSSPDGPDSVSISFAPQATELSASGETALAPIVERMNADEDVRVRLMAFASSNDESPSSVRRLSLNRAIAVREYLMDQGVQSTRIEVRALGDQSEGGDPDRVDAVLNYR